MALQTVTDSNSGDFAVEGTPDTAPVQQDLPVEAPETTNEASGEVQAELERVRDERGRFARGESQEAAEEPQEAVADADEPQLEVDGEEPAPEPEAKPKRHDPQTRIDKAIRAQREAERRAYELETRLQALEQARQAAPQALEAFPAWEPWFEAHQGASYEDYIDARADHRAESRILAHARQQAEQSQAREREERVSTLRERGQQVYSDWDDVFTGLNLNVPMPVYHAILTDPDGHRLAYDLATHPETVAQMAQMDPVQVGVALGMLKARHAAASNGPARAMGTSTAPRPIKPVGSSPMQPVPAAGSDDESFEAFARRENAILAKKRKERYMR